MRVLTCRRSSTLALFRVDDLLANLAPTRLKASDWEQLEAQSVRVGDEHSRIRRRQDGRIIKIFPLRRDPIARVRAQAERFVANAEVLTNLGFACPTMKEVLFIEEKFAAVIYDELEGESFRDLVARGAEGRAEGHDASDVEGHGDGLAELDRLPAYFAELHKAGVYFRGAHLGNLLRVSATEIGLLDFSDVRFANGALGVWKRARNLAHLLGHRLDGKVVQKYGYRRFVDAYVEAAALSPFAARRLCWFLQRRIGSF